MRVIIRENVTPAIWVTVQWASVTAKPDWVKVKREVMDLDNAAKAINELPHLSLAGQQAAANFRLLIVCS